MPAGGSTANWNTLAAAIMEGLCLFRAAPGRCAFLMPEILSQPDVQGTGAVCSQDMQHWARLHSQPVTASYMQAANSQTKP